MTHSAHETQESETNSETNIRIQDLKPGMKVVYHPIGTAPTTTTGKIERILKHDADNVGSQHIHVHADKSHPRIEIRNEHTDKVTAYKLENIVRIDEGEK